MYHYSDSESRDSDEGIRFKTDSTRNKHSPETNTYRSRSRSPKHKSRRFSIVKKSRRDTRSSSSDESSSRGDRKRKSEEITGIAVGPSLPPQMSPKEPAEESHHETDGSTVIGPVLPPHLVKHTKQISSEDSTSEEGCFGPQLPPHLLEKKSDVEETPRIGPQLPPHLRHKLQEESANTPLANITEDSDDEETYGPLPAGDNNYSKNQIALEERALQLKMDQLDPSQDKAPVREEWMIELPEVKASNLGLGPRQFRSKAGPDMSDRSAWTDAPNKKAKNEEVDLKKETEMKEVQRRNKEQERIAKKHKKKNKESLLELHQNEMKKKKEEKGGPSERRPFSRDIDLKVNRFDEAQKKAILKKAQLLDDRFSSGQSKFL